MFLKISQNLHQNTCASVSFFKKLQASVCNFVKKETRAQMFFREFCEIFKSTYFIEHLWATASVLRYIFPLTLPCTMLKNGQKNTARFLNYVRTFFNITQEKVKMESRRERKLINESGKAASNQDY